jgi:hypothetical protein
MIHKGTCPRIKSITYAFGTIERIEFFSPAEMVGPEPKRQEMPPVVERTHGDPCAPFVLFPLPLMGQTIPDWPPAGCYGG